MKKQPISPKLKKLVRETVKKHAWNIGYSHYTVDIMYLADDKNDDERASDVHAEATVDRRYLKLTIRIYPVAIREWKTAGDKALEHTIAHEVSHMATAHVMELMTCAYKDEGETKDAWESLTERIAQMSIRIDELEKK